MKLSIKKSREVRPNFIENDKKVDEFVQDLKHSLDELNTKTDEVIDNVISPVVKLVVDEVIPAVETVEQLFNAEPDDDETPILRKETLKINEPVAIEDEKVETLAQQPQIETQTIGNIEILAHEECLLHIAPKTKLQISHVICAHLNFFSPTDDVVQQIIYNEEDRCTFSLFVKNNGDTDFNANLTYSVMF